jgi:hypothetical protein
VDGVYLRALLIGALFALPSAIIVIVTSFWPDATLFQPNGFYLGSDFVNYWSGGRLALQGRLDVLYDLARYNLQLKEWFNPELRLMNFSYPPHALLLLAPVAAFPYLVALVLWSLAGAAGFVGVALGGKPEREDGRLLWALLLAPVLWVNIVFGQFGLLLAALFVGALRALPKRPVLAGILIGVLTVKPQLGLLLAPLLLLLGAWRALAAATLTALFMSALSVVAFGIDPWRVYFAETMPFQWHFIEVMDGFYRFQMSTPYTLFWFLGLPVRAALVLQAIVSVLIALSAFAVIRSEAPWPLKAAVVAFGSVLMVPYVLAYDLAIALAALVWCLRERALRSDVTGTLLIGALWALPFGLGILSQTQGVPLLPLMVLAFYFWLAAEALGWRSLRAAALMRREAASTKV